jgi:hypothetical protein
VQSLVLPVKTLVVCFKKFNVAWAKFNAMPVKTLIVCFTTRITLLYVGVNFTERKLNFLKHTIIVFTGMIKLSGNKIKI